MRLTNAATKIDPKKHTNHRNSVFSDRYLSKVVLNFSQENLTKGLPN